MLVSEFVLDESSSGLLVKLMVSDIEYAISIDFWNIALLHNLWGSLPK